MKTLCEPVPRLAMIPRHEPVALKPLREPGAVLAREPSRRAMHERPVLGAVRICALFLLAATGCAPAGPDLPPEVDGFGLTVETARLAPILRLFNFPEYLDEGLVSEFRERYGVRIVQDYFDTNEAMITRLIAGGGGQFDLVVASDYAVAILADAGQLQPLDASLLPNRANLHPALTSLPYDSENRYSIPYQWGTTGIGLREDRVSGSESDWSTWAVLFDPAREVGRFALLDDPRESIGAALIFLGHSVNSTHPDHLAEAEALLSSSVGRSVAVTPASTGRDLLLAGELALSHNHSGEIAMAAKERAGVVYLLPTEGAVVWADNLVIPARSESAYTAHVFMNFLLDPANGARLTEEIRYYSPNLASWALLEDDLRAEHEVFLGDGAMDRLQFIEDVGGDRRLFDEIWTRVKAGSGR